MQIHKEYVEKDGITLKVEVYYDKGGQNYFSGKWVRRGYYLMVIPVKREERNGIVIETVTAYSGVKMLLKEVQRQSKKAGQEALALAKEKINDLIHHVIAKQTTAKAI